MTKLYYRLFTVLSFALTISSCKIDAPVYPDGTILKRAEVRDTVGTGNTGTETGSGDTGTDNGEAVPIGPANTIQIKVDGVVKTYSQLVGYTSVLGVNGINGIQDQDAIAINYIGDGTGTFDIQAMQTADLNMDPLKTGKIVITEMTFDTATQKGTVKGTFTADMVDASNKTYSNVTGSFNISK